MITDDEAERAQDFLRSNAKKAGELRGERIYIEEMRKSLKSLLLLESNETTQSAREAHAYADDRYLEHLDKLRKAVVADEENRALREAACMKIEVWRSQSANVRGRI